MRDYEIDEAVYGSPRKCSREIFGKSEILWSTIYLNLSPKKVSSDFNEDI